jgi:branched-chain amino acid transport system substrate-binding protein
VVDSIILDPRRKEASMKRWLSIAAVVVLCLTLVIGIACGGGEGEEEEGVTELKFGFGLCFEGLVGAIIGVPARHAWELTNEEIGVFEVGGKPCRWKLIFEENHFNTAGGVASAIKLILDDNIDIMWQFGSDASMAAYEYCHDAEMIMDASGLPSYMLGPDKPYMFQVSLTADFMYPHFFDWLSREHPEVQRVVVVTTEDLMGQSIAYPVEALCEYYGLEETTVWYPTGTVEYFPIATKVMTYDPDLVIWSELAFDEMWDLGYDGWFVTMGFEEALAGELDWYKCTGTVFEVGPHMHGPWPEVQAFREQFEKEYGYECGTWPTYTRQVLMVWTEVLKKAGTVDFENDMDKIIETAETELFDTPYGPCLFGGEVVNEIGHILITETAINVIAGPSDYQLVEHMTAAENEALALEVYGGK